MRRAMITPADGTVLRSYRQSSLATRIRSMLRRDVSTCVVGTIPTIQVGMMEGEPPSYMSSIAGLLGSVGSLRSTGQFKESVLIFFLSN